MSTTMVVKIAVATGLYCALLLGTPPSQEVGSLISKLQSGDVSVRMAAFAELKSRWNNTLRQPDVRQAILQLLARETAWLRKFRRERGPAGSVGEGFSEYYARVAGTAQTVADYSNPEDLRILAEASYNSDSTFAKQLATHGQAIMPTVLKMAQSDLGYERAQAMGMLANIVERNPGLSTTATDEAKNTITKAASDPEVSVRYEAVRALGRVGDRTNVPRLEKIAAADPASYAIDQNRLKFPVREIARKAIEEIAQRERQAR